MVKTVGKYQIGKTLGEGTFGKVKFAMNTETGESVAIKVLDKEKIQKQSMGAQVCTLSVVYGDSGAPRRVAVLHLSLLIWFSCPSSLTEMLFRFRCLSFSTSLRRRCCMDAAAALPSRRRSSERSPL